MKEKHQKIFQAYLRERNNCKKQSEQSNKKRQVIIPNPILITDISDTSISYAKRKKKISTFMLQKKTQKKQNKFQALFTPQGIIQTLVRPQTSLRALNQCDISRKIKSSPTPIEIFNKTLSSYNFKGVSKFNKVSSLKQSDRDIISMRSSFFTERRDNAKSECKQMQNSCSRYRQKKIGTSQQRFRKFLKINTQPNLQKQQKQHFRFTGWQISNFDGNEEENW